MAGHRRKLDTPNATCPQCGPVSTHTIDSRVTTTNGDVVTRRRRVCKSCGERFSTLEMPVNDIDEFRREIKRRIRKELVEKLLKDL